MRKIKKGDIVTRKSHNEDILFTVERIVRSSNGLNIAILKGLTIRIVADSFLDDLILLDNEIVNNSLRSLDLKIDNKINKILKKNNTELDFKERNVIDEKTGRILHFDGDTHFCIHIFKFDVILGYKKNRIRKDDALTSLNYLIFELLLQQFYYHLFLNFFLNRQCYLNHLHYPEKIVDILS